MSEPPSQPQPQPQPPPTPETTPYWCYHCEKRVSVETLPNLPDVICGDCKNGFVESIPSPSLSIPSPSSENNNNNNDPYFGSHFLHVLRLIANSARDDDASPPPPPPPNRSPDTDFLRIELNAWGNDENDNDDENDVAFHHEESPPPEEGGEHEDPHIDEEDLRRRRRELLRVRIRDLATRTRSMRNRILDWAEILMGLEDNSIEFSLQAPDSDRYVGNPEDYVDAAEYEALLQTLAESDGGGRRGNPPAAKEAVEALVTVEVASESEVVVCAICKDSVGVGHVAKRLPCGHGYHGDCIVPWLSSRNSCPVCRFELPTNDREYERHRKNKRVGNSGSGASGSGSG